MKKIKSEILHELEEAKISKNLTLYHRQITDEIWNMIIKLTDLEFFDLHNCDFDNTPHSFSNFSKLKYLRIRLCKLTKFPESITTIKSLKDIDISYNILSEIPEKLQELGKLEKLDLSVTGITNFSFLKKFKNLKEINLSDNKLNEFPQQLFTLINLTHINLNENNISELPKEISELKKLNTLRLAENNFKIIPENIASIKKLEHLNLAYNQITNIPTDILQLSFSLVLSGNKITYNPNVLSQSDKYYFINLKDNPIILLEFGYYISIEKKETPYLYFKEFHKKAKNDIFNLTDLGYKIEYEKDLMILKTDDAHAFISIDNDTSMTVAELYDGIDLNEIYKANLLISTFGTQEAQQKILFNIRTKIEQWLTKKQIKSRFFYYPSKNNIDSEIEIDYDKLLKYKAANQYAFFDDKNEKKIPVSDLLKYIEIENIAFKKEWEGTNYITTIEIKNLKLFERIEFKLSPRINILLGYNGLGKTSILQGITMGLLPTENLDKSDNFTEYIKHKNERAEIYINYGEKEQRSIHVISSGLSEMKNIALPSHILLSYGVNLNADTKINTQFYEEIIEGNAKLYSTKSIFKDYSNDFNDPLLILYELQKESKHKPKIKDIVKLIVNKINEYLNLISEKEKMQLIEENDFFAFKDLNNNKLKLQNLSEGYKDHILLISDILFRIISTRNNLFKEKTIDENIFKRAKGVIIIDEFDRHLHPVWQRRLLLQLKKDFIDIQFILTTHNVFSLQSAVGATAHKILIRKNEIQIESSIIKAENILNIIREFYTKDFFDYETQNELNLLSEYLDKIHEGKIELVYSEKFRKTVEKLNNMGEEIQSIIASQLLQLNSALKKIDKKKFAL